MKYLLMAVIGLFVITPEVATAAPYVRVLVPTTQIVEVTTMPVVRVRTRPYIYRVYSKRHSSAIIRVR